MRERNCYLVLLFVIGFLVLAVFVRLVVLACVRQLEESVEDTACGLAEEEGEMKNEDVNEKDLKAGRYCRKGVPGCFCSVGWPYERQCPYCRDKWKDEQHRDSRCICYPLLWIAGEEE